MSKSLRLLILSKNRACQLDQCLRSVRANMQEFGDCSIAVLFVAGNEFFDRGYQIVKSENPEVDFVREDTKRSVGQQIVDIFSRVEAEFAAFLVDDDILIRPLSFSMPQFDVFRRNLNISALSLRLSPLISVCEVLGHPIKPHRLRPDGIFCWKTPILFRGFRKIFHIFPWKQFPPYRLLERAIEGVGVNFKFRAAWELPMSVDGNIFRYKQLLATLKQISNIKRTNALESELTRHVIPGKLGLCFDKSIVINIPMNRVDSGSVKFRSMGLSIDDINDRFLKGQRLAIRHLFDTDFNSCHADIEPQWVLPTELTARG